MALLPALQLAVLAILDGAQHYGWSVQGFGMLRLYIRDVGRLHIWDRSLRYPNVTMVHNHSWDLKSSVVMGTLLNTRFVPTAGGQPFHCQRLITGYDSQMVSSPTLVELSQQESEWYGPGEIYTQQAQEIHRTDAEDGTVTIMERKEDVVEGYADVYWPSGTEWGTAKPRAAMPEEIRRVVGNVLEKWKS